MENDDNVPKSHPEGERRQYRRFVIAAPAWFQWQTKDGNWHFGEGITRDVSRSGAFIATESLPSVASELSLTVKLPVPSNAELQVHLQGTGVVRYVQVDEAGTGYGASIGFCLDTGTEAI